VKQWRNINIQYCEGVVWEKRSENL
jgi:hypothetical protein